MPIEVTRTYLELTTPEDLDRSKVEAPPEAAVSRRFPVFAARFRMLYECVGSEHGWHDRDPWPDSDIEARYAGDRVSIWELEIARELAGFYELERHPDGSIEIVLFGLFPSFAGRGAGKWLLVNAVDRAWQLGASRVWLHTCTLDSPRALPNYLARGFRPYRSEHYQVGGPAA
jgi:GNAT superfamily N-acetyltransferase